MPPLAGTPVLETGWRPPLLRPSPPPRGWSIGFIALARVCGRMPMCRPARLPDADVDPVQIPELSDGCPTSAADAAHLARRENNHRPLTLARSQPPDTPGRTHQLP